MADDSNPGTYQTELSKDLLSAAAQYAAPKQSNDLHVEGWRNSWLARISELLVGKD